MNILHAIANVTDVHVAPHDPWCWHRTQTSSNREAVGWWAVIESLRDRLAYENWELRRIGRTLVVLAETPYSRPTDLQACIVALDAAWPAICHQVEYFPALGHQEARDHMAGLARGHWREGFEIDWGTLWLPANWPGPVKRNLCPIFGHALGCEGGVQ